MATTASVDATPKIDHREAMTLAEEEFARMVALVRQLTSEQWHRQTVCEEWDVRAMVAHVLGMAEAQASPRQFVHDFRAAGKRSGGAMIDAMTATQVRERAHLTAADLVDRLIRAAPRAVRARRRIPALIRSAARIKPDPPFDQERWPYGYLVDTIFNRDTWMHRLDICRATGHEMVLTSEHDGRLVADVVADWARRHGRPFTLALDGPTGGRWDAGTGGQPVSLDALDFCWILARRAPGTGLLATPVPF